MKSYIFENKIIEDWIHLLRLKSCFKAILALLLSLKALLITKVVREAEHILLAHLKFWERKIWLLPQRNTDWNFSCTYPPKQVFTDHFTEYGVEYFGYENILKKGLSIYLKE